MVSRITQLAMTTLLAATLLVSPAGAMFSACCCSSAGSDCCSGIESAGCETAGSCCRPKPADSCCSDAADTAVCFSACCHFCEDCASRNSHEDRILVSPIEIVLLDGIEHRIDAKSLFPAHAGKAFDHPFLAAIEPPLRIRFSVWLI